MPSTTKDQWRNWARGRTDDIDAPAASAYLVEHLARWLPEDSVVLTYLPMPHEPDLRALRHRHLHVTRTPDDGPLTVHSVDSPRERHRWGFEQPVASAPQIDPRSIDVVLVPGVVFDRTGGRIGHGKGYYDRLLAACRPDVSRVGIAFSVLVVDDILPTEPHDVRMTHLATERGVLAAVSVPQFGSP